MTESKKYFCEWLGYEISGVAARNCNYSDIENYQCQHDGKPCVAKEGLEAFAQSSAKDTDSEKRKFLRSLLLAPVRNEWEHD